VAAADQLVEHHRCREEIGPAIELIALGDLRGHVHELAQDHAGVGALRRERALGQAEVDDLHLALVAHQHVLRRHVAVHQAQRVAVVVLLAMRVGQRVEHAQEDLQAQPHRHALAARLDAGEQRAQVLAVHELQRDVAPAVDRAHVGHLGDGAVLQVEQHPRLGLEPAHELRIGGQLHADALEHQELAQARDRRGLGQEDLAHAADRQLRHQRVPAKGHGRDGRRREARCGLGHRWGELAGSGNPEVTPTPRRAEGQRR